MTYKTILDKHGNLLPHRFLVKYAVSCAKSCSHLTDAKSQAALAVAERYGNGEDVSDVEREKALDVASAATAASYDASYDAVDAVDATFFAFYVYYSSYDAATSASYAEDATPGFDATALLVNMLKEEFTEFDRIMMRISDAL